MSQRRYAGNDGYSPRNFHWGVDLRPLAEATVGERIPAWFCHRIAEAIDTHLGELDAVS